MRMRTTLSVLGMLLLATTSYAQRSDSSTRPTGEVAMSNDTLQLRYISSGEAVGVGGSRFQGTFLLTEDRDIVFSGGLLFPTSLDLGRLKLTIGPQLYAALLQDKNNDVMALSVGADLRYLLNRQSGLAIAGQAFYAPDILTFGSADRVTDFSARVELNVAPRLVGFGGMRWFEFDLTNGAGKRKLQEELFFGVGYRF